MRILVIENELTVAAVIKRRLEQEAYLVDVAYDGVVGLSYIFKEEYDAIVLSHMLPGPKDAKAICKELRNKDVKTSVLVLSASDTKNAKSVVLSLSVDKYLTKPINLDELIVTIHAMLGRQVEPSSTTLISGKLSMEPTTKTVKYGAKNVRLTAKEFKLLEYLLRHKGRVISKNELIAHVWSEDDDILPNTVEVYVGYLRKKIDRPFKSRFVQTIRGYGYKIAV